MISRKLLLTSALCATVGFYSFNASATDVDVDATLTASAAVTLVKDSDMDFAGIDYAAGHTGTMELEPDSTVSFSVGPTNMTASGTPAAGQISITSAANTIDVTCDATGVISDGTRDVNITEVKWDVSATTYALAANTCGGLGVGAVSLDTGASPNPVLYIGSQLDITQQKIRNLKNKNRKNRK